MQMETQTQPKLKRGPGRPAGKRVTNAVMVYMTGEVYNQLVKIANQRYMSVSRLVLETTVQNLLVDA